MLTIMKMNGRDEATALQMLRLTARTSFLIFLLIFITRPLRQLLKSPLTAKMLKNRRFFGIALAGSNTVHLALIIWFFTWISDTGPPIQIIAVGGVGYLLIYLMLITSFDRPAAAIGPTAWRRLHKTGIYWAGTVFAVTFIPKFIAVPDDPVYLIATLLILSAVGIRGAAFARRKTS